MVENSTYDRGKLKKRLFAQGLKQRVCELCGQGEIWNGRRMALVLDHINGVSNDHRLENLQIVCANCAATLETHCGRNVPRERICPGCRQAFVPSSTPPSVLLAKSVSGGKWRTTPGIPQPGIRRVERPSYEQLMEDVRTMSFLAVGRKYGVTDNAVRKWIRWYERGKDADEEAEAG